MPKAMINGVNLYYEVTGEGFPLVWSHEFAGAYESWNRRSVSFHVSIEWLRTMTGVIHLPMCRRTPRPTPRSSR